MHVAQPPGVRLARTINEVKCRECRGVSLAGLQCRSPIGFHARLKRIVPDVVRLSRPLILQPGAHTPAPWLGGAIGGSAAFGGPTSPCASDGIRPLHATAKQRAEEASDSAADGRGSLAKGAPILSEHVVRSRLPGPLRISAARHPRLDRICLGGVVD